MLRGLTFSLSSVAALSLLAAAGSAHAQSEAVEQVVVTGDAARLLDVGASRAAFGLDKALVDTPRAVTLVSDTTIDRYA